jgi:murein L,D-transpeptidase YafK
VKKQAPKRPLPIILLPLLVLAAGVAGFPLFGELAAQEEYLPNSILHPGERPGIILVVDKTRQELRIYRHEGDGRVFLEKIIPCSTGMARGDKLARGDKKTPDGYYVFNQKLLRRELPEIYGVLAYPMDYPNFWDRALGHGGDGIWTHGVNKPLVDYDSNGCVELFNHDLAALEEYISLYDTPILLAETLRLAPARELKAEGRKVLAFLETWRRAWAAEDFPLYRSLYSPDEFRNSDNLNYEAWMRHKENVARVYEKIEVDIDGVSVFRHRDVVVASFTQSYRGDRRYSSKGEKRLYLKPAGDGYLIVAEEFLGDPVRRQDKWLTAEEKREALTTPPVSVAASAVPVVTASAGAIDPGAAVLTAENNLPNLATDASPQAEEARAVIEARARSRGAAEPPLSDDSPDLADLDVKTPSPLAVAATRPVVPDTYSLVKTPEPAESVSGRIARPEGGEAPVLSSASLSPTPASSPPSPASLGDLSRAVSGPAPPEALENARGAESAGAGSERSAPPAPTAADGSVLTAAASPAPSGNTDEAQLLALLSSWEASWEEKDAELFFSHYAGDFYFPDKDMGLSAFKNYRGRLISRAGEIKVETRDPEIEILGDQARISFTQNYRSDEYQDEGVKTLTLSRSEKGWKITSETFRAKS